MGTASSGEWIAILLYFALVIGVGVYFFFRDRHQEGEKEYFLGGRSMGGWVAALSAGASDMSAWVLMGLPGSIYLYGIGKVWISVGLLIGTVCAWIFVAPRLRRYSIRANDSITIPQFLTNRFLSKNKGLQIISAIVFVVVYCVYSASSISACGTLFNTVTGMSAKTAMIIATAIILVYVFLGGFNAVCWTDFFQGMLMLAALMLTPILALFVMKGADFVAPVMAVPENYYNVLSGGGFNWKSMSDIISGLGWGLGYFGMPHILVRYLSIKSEHEMRKSQIIGCSWIVLILAMSAVVAYFIAADPNCGGIMALVECAWAGFGSAFGPVILLSLYWRRLTYSGAVAGVCVGFAVDALWYAFLSTPTGLYEIIPGFLCGLIAAVVVSLCSKAPSKEVTDLFDRAFEPTD